MSIQPESRPETAPRSEQQYSHDDRHEHDHDRDATVALQELVCPTGGAIIPFEQKIAPGRFECPRCQQVWDIWEVHQA